MLSFYLIISIFNGVTCKVCKVIKMYDTVELQFLECLRETTLVWFGSSRNGYSIVNNKIMLHAQL